MAEIRERAVDALLKSRPLRITSQAVFTAALIVISSFVIASSPSLSRSLPTIPDLFVGLGDVLTAAAFWEALGHTLLSAGTGLLLCLLIGAPLGALIASHRFASGSTSFLIDFMRAIPALALIPVALLVLGPTSRMEITLIVLSAIWPIIIQVFHAIRNIPVEYLDMARSFRLPMRIRTLFIVAPAVGPMFATAVRLSATLCLLLAIGTELLATGAGVGYLVGFFQQADRVPEVYALVVIIGLIGVAVNNGLLALERRLFVWQHRTMKGRRDG